MVYEFKFPDIGEGITKGKIIEWVVKEGAKVKEDDTIAKVETDKALADIPSPKTGTIEKIMVQAGNDIQVGQTLVTIAVEGDESGPSPSPQSEPTEKSETEPVTKVDTKPLEQKKDEVKEKDGGTGAVGELESASDKTNLFDFSKKPAPSSVQETTTVPTAQTGTTGLAMLGVRQLAKQKGVDISTIQGSGSQGQVTAADIQGGKSTTLSSVPSSNSLRIQSPSGDIIEITGNVQGVNFVQFGGKAAPIESTPQMQKEGSPIKEQPDSQPTIKEAPATTTSKPGAVKRKYDTYGFIDRKPFTGLRKTIAENMMKSVTTTAQVTAMDEIDVTELWKIREAEAKKAEKKKVKLTFLPYITRATINALRKVPAMNATLDEANEEIILKKYYNIGQAVATEAGLMVIVIKRAEHKTLYLLGKEVHDLAQKARDRKIDISELKGSSFTITNYGSIGGSYGTPIINPGNSAILGMGRIRPVPYIVGKKTEIRYLLPISLTFDHRITDGAEAAYFLNYLKEELENPKNLSDAVFMKNLKDEEKFDIE